MNLNPEVMRVTVDLELNLQLLTKQRAHLLAVMDDDGRPDSETLDGLLHMLDFISDAAESQGLLTESDRDQWWRTGCIEAGLGDPDAEAEGARG